MKLRMDFEHEAWHWNPLISQSNTLNLDQI